MKQEDIRPADVWDRYLAAVAEDIADMFQDKSSLEEVLCPACAEAGHSPAFAKAGFTYVTCNACSSLYLNPRPTLAGLSRFYTVGKASQVWANDFYPITAKKRKETIVLERVRFLQERAAGLGVSLDTVMDIGCGYGTFLHVLKREMPGVRTVGIEPGESLAEESRAKGIEVVEDVFENAGPEWNGTTDVVTCFEVLEHLHDPFPFLKKMASVIRGNGMAWLTSLGCDGFDVQVLWGDHKNIYPPCHINILSLRGMEILAKRAGFGKVEFVTPGKLDVDIVRNSKPDSARLGPFLDGIIRQGREEDIAALQEALVKMKRSSHVWVFGQKA